MKKKKESTHSLSHDSAPTLSVYGRVKGKRTNFEADGQNIKFWLSPVSNCFLNESESLFLGRISERIKYISCLSWAQGSDPTIMDSVGNSDPYGFLTCYYFCSKTIGTMNWNKLKTVQYRDPEDQAAGFGEGRREQMGVPTTDKPLHPVARGCCPCRYPPHQQLHCIISSIHAIIGLCL